MDHMFLRKEIGQSGVAGYWWDEDGSVVKVPWDLGVSLLELPGAGYSQVLDAVSAHDDYDPGLPSDVPDGTAVDVMDWVGVDKNRAAAALAAEKAKGNDARTSLIAKLEKLVV